MINRSGPLARAAQAALTVDGKADRALDLARSVGRWLPFPGTGRTAERWAVLTAVAAADLTAARVLEAHTDALAILAEASADPDAAFSPEPAPGDQADADRDGDPLLRAEDPRTWGVFAAEGPGVRVDARRAPGVPGGWQLTGTKPWCSLAGELTNALITAHTGAGTRRLFSIDLRGPGVRVAESGWVAKGLPEVVSGPIDLLDCPARPVGPDGWYLDRPGFGWGGIGVAACWFGGAVGIARTLRESLGAREPDQIAQMHVGAVDVATDVRTIRARSRRRGGRSRTRPRRRRGTARRQGAIGGRAYRRGGHQPSRALPGSGTAGPGRAARPSGR